MRRTVIAVVDTETTGVDPKKDRVIEAAWALVDVPTAEVVEIGSRLFRSETNEAEAVNGIPAELVQIAEPGPTLVNFATHPLAGDIEAIVAHNAEFDRQWDVFAPLSIPWLDTRDWRWPKSSSDATLVQLALAHGIGVTSAHRAYTDVLILAALLRRVHETVPLSAQLEYARLPRHTYEAFVSFEKKDMAKQAGFRWEPDRKRWTRRMLPEDAAKLPFKTRILAA